STIATTSSGREILQPLRLVRSPIPRSRWRYAAALPLQRLQHGALSEPEGGRWLPAGVARPGAAVQARDRTAAWPMDPAGRIPREWRDHYRRSRARDHRGGA